jgi:hypothetical protein
LRELVSALDRLRGRWKPAYDAHRKANAELRALDSTYEPRTLPAVRFESGLTVNDRSDPAVAAILDIQAAMDEHEQRRRGEPSLRSPDGTVPDVAWNAVVWGYRSRLFGTGGEAGYAAQLAARLVWRELVPASAEANMRYILGGLLPFLWGQQRVTHLDRWFGQAEAEVVRLAIESVNHQWVPPETSPAASLAAEALASLDKALAMGATTGASKYARARAALAGAEPSVVSISRLKELFERLVARCQRDHADASSDLAAWLMGLVADRANVLAGSGGRPDQALALRSISDAFAGHAEGWLMKYLHAGFQTGRSYHAHDLLARWSSAEL